MPARTASRGSGTSTTAWLERPPATPERVSAENRVDFPEYGKPTIPMSFIAGRLVVACRAMDTGLKDKGVLITGAAGGIGTALSRTFAAEGARVCVHYRSSGA